MRMMRKFKLLALSALSLAIAAPALAGDANTMAEGTIDALDANQGTGTQVNADDWSEISNVLAGSGMQAIDTGGDANTGSGAQNNTYASQDGWEAIDNANAGSGAQVMDSSNSNGGDRTSSDIVISLGSHATVANSALEASISGNAVTVGGEGEGGGAAGSSLSITDESGFFNLAGVNAIALSSGHNSSQNISVNVTASVGTSHTNIGE